MKLPANVTSIISSMKQKGFEAYAVGGSVRDTLMGKETHGWDFTTNATPEEILAVFPDSLYDNQFGTVGIKIRDDAQKNENGEAAVVDVYEMTTYRSEQGYGDFRHPDTITWGKTLAEDLARRDLTINAIATDGEIIVDPFGGQEDLQKMHIRSVGDPGQRFSEDALRMMRAVRIASQLGFTIEEETSNAIKEKADLIKKISRERVRDELFKILVTDFAADAIVILKNVGLLTFILPELEQAFAIPQKSPKRHHIYDVGTHSLMAMKFTPSKNPIVKLAALLHDIGKPPTYKKMDDGVITFYNHEVVGFHIAKQIAERLRLSNKQRDLLLTIIRWHQFSVDERQTDAALRRFIRRVGKENLDDMLAVRIGDRLGGGALETSWRLELYKKRLIEVQEIPFSVSDLAVDGHDVMEMFSIRPGKIIGDILDALFSQVDAGTIPNDRQALLSEMKKIGETMIPKE